MSRAGPLVLAWLVCNDGPLLLVCRSLWVTRSTPASTSAPPPSSTALSCALHPLSARYEQLAHTHHAPSRTPLPVWQGCVPDQEKAYRGQDHSRLMQGECTSSQSSTCHVPSHRCSPTSPLTTGCTRTPCQATGWTWASQRTTSRVSQSAAQLLRLC
jgi:hypothetical protein